ncbi:MAG: site-specific integrase [Clostridium sp.]|nr:site-specific integrase [Clostridium sp.]
MAKVRKDSRGRVLLKGESERKNGYYIYQYTDFLKKRRVIYDKDLIELRRRKNKIQQNITNGFDDELTLNDLFDKYMTIKNGLKQSTKMTYIYMFDHYVRPSFGKRKVDEIKYSDLKFFYCWLLKEKNLNLNTLNVIHTAVHPVFTMAVRDELIRSNPSDYLIGEIKKEFRWAKTPKRALTIEEQKAFMQYAAQEPLYNRWLPLLITLLGTGCRIGEVTALQVSDIDFINRTISITSNLTYRMQESGKCEYHMTSPKSTAGIRTIPMLDIVYEALQQEVICREQYGLKSPVIDGFSDFLFLSRRGKVHNSTTVNRAIKEIYEAYNKNEAAAAACECRQPQMLPHFTCHSLRHTFCTRLYDSGADPKFVQYLMGHSDYQITMDIYTEITESKKKASFKKLQNKITIM